MRSKPLPWPTTPSALPAHSPTTLCSPTGTARAKRRHHARWRTGETRFARRSSSALGPGRPEILVSLDDGASGLLEGRLVGEAGDPLATFVASLQLDGAGSITRCLLFRTPFVEPSPTWGAESDASPADARAALDTYFEHLEHGRFEAAANCFSEDCLYSHPPYAPGAGRAEFRGRAELLAGFVRRGNRPYEHALAVTLQRGQECMIEGTATGTALGGSFVSSLSLDGEGLIRRYAAFYCEPPVPRR